MFNINKPVYQEHWMGDSSYKSSSSANTTSWEDKISINDEQLLEYYQQRFNATMRKGGMYSEYWQNKIKELRSEIENS